MIEARAIFAALTALVLDASASADAPPRPIELADLAAPTFTTFSERDGVPASVIVNVQTDRDGFVWLAAARGLARFDGRSWHADEAFAAQGSIGYLLSDHDGTLWVGFRDRGIGRFDGGQWRFDARPGEPAPMHVRRLTETVDAGGRRELWASTLDDGLFLRDGDRWIRAPGSEGLPQGGVLTVARTHTLEGHERLWAGTLNEGLWFQEDGGEWQRLRTRKFDPAEVEHVLAATHDGHEELWVATFGYGLWRLDPSGWRVWNVAQGDLPADDLYELAQSALPNGDRAIWAASRAGLIRIHADAAQVFDRRHGLPSNAVRGVSVWRSPAGSEVLWVATENGVARSVIGASQWQTASLMGTRSVGVFGVLVEPDGSGGERLWLAATADGLGLYEHGRWRYFNSADGTLPDSDARMIKRSAGPDGTTELWLGMRYGHLLRVHDGPRFETIDTPWEKHLGQAVLDVLGRTVAGRYERWIVTRQSGLYRWRDGAWTAFRPATAVGQWRAQRVLEQVDAGGRSWLWATSNQGLARFDGERWTLLDRGAGLPDVSLIGLALMNDAQGHPVLWIGSTSSGIVRVDVTDPLQPRVLADALPVPPDPTAYGALRASDGRVYVCTNAGVQLLTPSGDGRYASRVFTRRDGIVHEECNTNAQFIDAHDRFWTGTLGGATVFDPALAPGDATPKPLRLTSVRIDGNAAGPDGARMLPHNRELHVEFALLSWQRETETRFRTQLVGYESAPGAWTTNNYRNFNALPAGSYVLRVEGRDYTGNASAPLVVPVDVEPAWWQQTAARTLFAAAGLVAAYALVAMRVRRLRAQRRRLEEQVAERTADLNAANARLRELSYQDALTGIANRRSLLAAMEAAVADRAFASLIFVDVDHFKDYNDHWGHPAGDEALCRVAHTILAIAPPDAHVARYGGEEFACLLPGADVADALAIAERIRAAVEACDVPIPATVLINHVTISAGVAGAALATADDIHRLLREADNALYRAKNDGRNCVHA